MLHLRSSEVYISGALEALSLATYISDAMGALSQESVSPEPWRLYLRSLHYISGAWRLYHWSHGGLYNLKPGDYVLGTPPETISMSSGGGHIFGAMKPPS
jgi:hypothetical protein